MAVIRVGISAALGVLVTFALIILMYKLIDSGNKDMDDKETIKIADFLHVDRQLTENAKQTQVEKPLRYLARAGGALPAVALRQSPLWDPLINAHAPGALGPIQPS